MASDKEFQRKIPPLINNERKAYSDYEFNN